MYDVVVVGARCAGASLAMLVARAGHRVALVDRASFPSDTMSTHFLWQRGAAHLQSWGLLNRLEERGCRPIREITFDVGPVRLTGIGPAVGSVANTYCARRTVLDTVLVEAAVEAGADLIEKFTVRDVLRSGEQVVGIRGGSGDTELRAGIVVGADGLHSTVARKLGAQTYRELPSRTAVYYSYWSGLQHLGACFYARPDRLILTWPTNDGLTCVYVAWPRREFHEVRTDVARNFHAALEVVPHLRDAVASAQQQAPFIGTGDLPNLYRTSAGPGWALIGDAGHHKDPSTGMGIADAFLSADLLAEAIDDGISERQPMPAALACYQQRRDALTAECFELALSTARLAPLTPAMETFYRDAADQPDVIERIFGVLGGTIPRADVFAGVGR